MTEHRTLESPDMGQPLRAVFGETGPGTIFSGPETVGDSLVFTASAWERAGGFGFGSGQGVSQGEEGAGGGGGGGGASQGRPVAVIRVSPGGIEIKPVLDFTKIGITVFVAVMGWLGARRRAGG